MRNAHAAMSYHRLG